MCSIERSPAADGAGDVGDRRVALQVDELGASRPHRTVSGTRHSTSGAAGGRGIRGGRQPVVPRRLEGQGGQRLAGHPLPVGQAPGQVEHAGRGAGHGQAVELLPRDEGPEVLVVAEPAPGLAEQVHRGVPPPADQEQVARDRLGRPDLSAQERGDERVGDPLDAAGTGHDTPRTTGIPARSHSSTRRAGTAIPGVDHGLHPHARAVQVEGGVVGAVVRGEDDGLATGEHAVAVQERPGGAGEHDARTVVVGEDDRTLVGSGRDDDRAGPDAPHPLAGEVLGRGRPEVVGTPLERQHEAVVVAAEGGGPLQVQHLRVVGQFGDRGGDPVQRRSAVEPVGAVDEGSSEPPASDCSSTRATRAPARAAPSAAASPAGTGAHDEHVDVVVDGVVAGGVRRRPRAGPDPAGRGPRARRRARRWRPAASARGRAPRSAPGRRSPRPRPR